MALLMLALLDQEKNNLETQKFGFILLILLIYLQIKVQT